MAVRRDNEEITSAGTFVWTGQGNNDESANSIRSYRDLTVSNEGAGVATLTVSFGQGYQTLASLASGDFDTYLIPGAIGVTVTATGDDVDVTLISHEKIT